MGLGVFQRLILQMERKLADLAKIHEKLRKTNLLENTFTL